MALCRALTEAAQSRLTAITGARDDLPPVLYRAAAPPVASGRTGRTVGWDWGRPLARSFTADVRALTDLIAERTGRVPIEVVLPSPGGVPVVKVIAPGLRFDDRRELGDSGPRTGGVPS
ncbi:hypothetical protein BJF79_23660 [Actinomadura sp. CNU-125]|nr:hypothetical protein BJF79_23660 [Actinomadura sp. CNU-125]